MTAAEYAQLVDSVRDAVHTYAAWHTGHLDDAADVTQEAFCRLWVEHRRVHHAAGRSWLLRTAGRLCIDRLRRHRARPINHAADVALLTDGHVNGRANGNGHGHGQSDHAAMQRRIGQALAELEPTDRALIVLRERFDMPYSELSQIFERPGDTLKVAVHRAKTRLRQRVLDAGPPNNGAVTGRRNGTTTGCMNP